MKKSHNKKHPMLLSLGYLIILSLFASMATVIAIALRLSPINTMLIQICSFLLSSMVALVIMVKSKYTLHEYGLNFNYKIGAIGRMGILPLIVVEAIPLIVGVDKSITFIEVIVIVLFIAAAAINEELYFRGLILKTLSVKGTKFAVIISAILFGIVHLGSLTVGKGIKHTILLVMISALFAFVSAEFVVLTGSIVVPVVWHFTRNLLSSITLEPSNGITLIILAIQSFILLSFAVYLWKQVKKQYLMYRNDPCVDIEE